MWLVLCSATDTSGSWAYHGLRQLGVAPLQLVTAEALADARYWEHRLNGGTHLKIALADGRVICSAQVRGALNRLLGPAAELSQRTATSDREYVQAEMFAFYLSWLNGLSGVVVNRPMPMGLNGPWYHLSEWVYRASRAGLPTPPYRMSCDDEPDAGYASLAPAGAAVVTSIALRGQVFGASLPSNLARGCEKLADDVATDLLGVSFYQDNYGQWTFAGATPLPDLTQGGLPLLNKLAQTLTQGEVA
jgi:hypothetical protein